MITTTTLIQSEAKMREHASTYCQEYPLNGRIHLVKWRAFNEEVVVDIGRSSRNENCLLCRTLINALAVGDLGKATIAQRI